MSKIGFVFSGEGARGAITAAESLALYKQGIKADFTIGISSGNANSFGYSYVGPEKLCAMWKNVHKMLDLFNINWQTLWDTGFLKQKPMEKLFREMIKNEPICESVSVSIHLPTGQMRYLNNKEVSAEEFMENTLAGVAIPGFCKDRSQYTDAGVRQMAPLRQCLDAGCTEIYVLLGRPLEFPVWTPPKGLLKAIMWGYRAVDVSLHEILVRDIQSCLRKNGDPGFKNIPIHVLHPNTLLYDCVEFNKCPMGVACGLTEYTELHETAMRQRLL